jgi:hypothetical protein
VRRVRGVVVVLVAAAVLPACATAGAQAPPCAREGNRWTLVLVAQSAPSATFLPCIATLPTGWTLTSTRFERGSYTAWFDSDRAGVRALEIHLASRCDVGGAVRIPAADAPTGVRTFEEPLALSPAFSADRYLVFAGGCVTYSFRFQPSAPATLALEVQQSLGLVPRSAVRRFVEPYGLDLCGAGAPPCVG